MTDSNSDPGVTGQWRGRGAGMAGVARAIGIVWAWVARACDPRGVSVGVLPPKACATPVPRPRHARVSVLFPKGQQSTSDMLFGTTS
eukprot:gene20531-biopygen8572